MTTKTNINPVAWFEIASTDTVKAREFYGSMFGWTSEEMPGDGEMEYHIVSAGDGPQGGITKAGGETPTYAIFFVAVPDCAAACQQAAELGGTVVSEPVVMDGGLSVAYLADLDGNHIGVFTPPTA